MKTYEATEQAYKRGYENGFKEGYTGGVAVGQRKALNWIPVTESLPKEFVSVLTQMPGEKPFPTVREGYIATNGVWIAGNFVREPGEVTHWMPMPNPPREGNDEQNTL